MMDKNTSKRKKIHHEKVPPSINEGESYTDFLCPICLELLIEPITLPCKHELCSACFEPHLENSSLCCPMCRKRVSIWVRENRKKKSMVNEERWNLIKTLYPERVKLRMDGSGELDESYNDYSAPARVIASQGEVYNDYREELEKIQEEEATALQLDLEYIKKIEDEEFEELKSREEQDRATAHALQKEEMKNLGVTLASPTEHQKKLLEMLRPKSPIKLRDKKPIKKTSEKHKVKKKVETSSKGSIKRYFVGGSKENTPCRNLINSNRLHLDSDMELAKRLQEEFYSQDISLLKVSSQPLAIPSTSRSSEHIQYSQP